MKPALVFPVIPLLCASCFGGIPGVGPDRESGQSQLMGKTLAGQNDKCDAKHHKKPFVIEWDATDMSTFEARAATDVVFVKYEDCELTVLDGCADDSIRGAFGTYRPIEWTSGSVEAVDIQNEAELYAKLPLGVVSLGGRVAAGEQFHMEYFVAGVRTSTRPTVARRDLDRISECKGATHFVYGYNVGAFALGSTKSVEGELGVNALVASAGGKSKFAKTAEKKGGLIESCRGASAKESQTCKVPIRLVLRDIDDGSEVDVSQAHNADDAQSLNAAAKINRERSGEKNANALYRSALAKMTARDGKGCLTDLDGHDKLAPDDVSTDPQSMWSTMRMTCLMLAGKCSAGRALDRKSKQSSMHASAEMLDTMVSDDIANYCEGDDLSVVDQVRRAVHRLEMANVDDVPLATCKSAHATLEKLGPSLSAAQKESLRGEYWKGIYETCLQKNHAK